MYEYLSPKDGPVVEGLEAQEVVYAKDQPEYIPLRTLRSSDPMRKVLSRWTLTEEQRKAVADGADIFLELSTFGNPLQPIRMSISDAKGEHFADWFKVCILSQPVVNAAKSDIPRTLGDVKQEVRTDIPVVSQSTT